MGVPGAAPGALRLHMPTRPALPHATTAGPKPAAGEFHIPSLDGVRAVSFAIVYLAHGGLGHVIPGGFGVTIFFFLSGFLITTLLRLEQDRTGRVSLRDFYLRRVFRILPPFYAVLAAATAITLLGILPYPLGWRPLLAQVLHVTNYWVVYSPAHGAGLPAGTVVYWSLAVEEHFYLLFPFLFIALQHWLPRRRGAHAALSVALCLAVLAWRIHLRSDPALPGDRTGLCTDTRVDSILYGCALALGANPMLDTWRGSRALWTRLLLPIGCALLLISFAMRDEWFRETFRYTLQGMGLAPLFVVAIRYPDWGPCRALNVGWVRRLGGLSYAMYLLHQVVLAVLEVRFSGLSMLLIGPLGFAVTYGLSVLVQRWVEQPSARLRRRWVRTDWLKRADPGAAAASDAGASLGAGPSSAATPASRAR